MFDVALASCAVLPEPDPDQALLEAALARRGLRAATLAWGLVWAAGNAVASTFVGVIWSRWYQRVRR